MADPTYHLTVAGSAVPDSDILRISVDRSVASVFDRLRMGRARVILDNFNGDYSPQRTPDWRPNQTVALTADSLPASASQLLDVTTFNNVGSIVGGRYVEGLIGNNALHFLGSSGQVVNFGAVQSLQFFGTDKSYTVECWARQRMPHSNQVPGIIDLEGGSPRTGYMMLYGNSGHTLRHERWVSGVQVGIAVNSVPDQTWMHVACTHDAAAEMIGLIVHRRTTPNSAVLFDISTATDARDISSHGAELLFGGRNLSTSLSRMDLDDVRIWNYARTQAQIEADMFSSLTGVESGLVGYWNMEETETYELFNGFLDRIDVRPEMDRREVVIQASDRARYMKQRVSIDLKVDTNPSSLFAEIFAQVGSLPNSTDTMYDNINFAFIDNISGGDALDRVLRSGAHGVYVAGAGHFVAKDRNFQVGQTAIASYANEGFSLTYALNDRDVINRSTISANRRKLRTDVATVAWLENVPFIINSGETKGIFLEFVDPDTLERPTPVNSVITPVQSLDFLANEQQSGGGSDVTSAMTINFTPYAETAVASVTNNSGAAAYLTHFMLRGNPLLRTPAFRQITEDSSSQAVYAVQDFEIENDLISDSLRGKDYADYLVSRYKNPLPEISFTLKNRFPDVMAWELLERITLIESNAAVNSAYLIESIDHDISLSQGLEHRTTFGLRLADTLDFLILDKDPEGKLDIRKLGF